jgi:hypothetical protein
MKLLTATLACLVACSRAAAPDAMAKAPAAGTFTDTDGKPVEVASLYQGHCAVVTFYRGFF